MPQTEDAADPSTTMSSTRAVAATAVASAVRHAAQRDEDDLAQAGAGGHRYSEKADDPGGDRGERHPCVWPW